jgi:hypothetical protein
MNYSLHYEKLVIKAKNRKLDTYKEIHHIVPKCLGGSNDKENLVELTAREHFIAHLLLLKIYPNKYSLIKAVQMMCIHSNNQERSMNRMYGWLKERFSKEMSMNQSGTGNSQFGTKWIYNLELKESKKILKTDSIPNGWLAGRVVDFDKHIAKLNKPKLPRKQIVRIDKTSLKEQKILEKKLIEEKNKKYILGLFDEFKRGNFYSVSEFHKKNNLTVSRMTLTNYWRKYIPEYSENSKEGKRFRL